MALVQNPFLSTDARGSLSGLTASRSRAGPVIKRKSKPPTRRGNRQPSNRSIFGWLSRQWGALTDAQRSSWKAWAATHPGTDKFGESFIMSGLNAFIQLNHVVERLYGAGEFHTLPPEDTPASSGLILTAVAGITNPGDIDLSWTEEGTGLATDLWEIWQAGPFQSPGRVEVEGMFKYIGDVAGNVLLDTIADLDEGFWYWFQIRYVDEYGQVTVWVVDQATPKVTP